MRDNRSDRTIERNYTQKRRFLIAMCELVKANKHPKSRFAQDFHPFHGVNRQTFAKYYNRRRASGGDPAALLPAKRGPRWRPAAPSPSSSASSSPNAARATTATPSSLSSSPPSARPPRPPRRGANINAR